MVSTLILVSPTYKLSRNKSYPIRIKLEINRDNIRAYSVTDFGRVVLSYGLIIRDHFWVPTMIFGQIASGCMWLFCLSRRGFVGVYFIRMFTVMRKRHCVCVKYYIPLYAQCWIGKSESYIYTHLHYNIMLNQTFTFSFFRKLKRIKYEYLHELTFNSVITFL